MWAERWASWNRRTSRGSAVRCSVGVPLGGSQEGCFPWEGIQAKREPGRQRASTSCQRAESPVRSPRRSLLKSIPAGMITCLLHLVAMLCLKMPCPKLEAKCLEASHPKAFTLLLRASTWCPSCVPSRHPSHSCFKRWRAQPSVLFAASFGAAATARSGAWRHSQGSTQPIRHHALFSVGQGTTVKRVKHVR